jgi:hypothetical protein
MAHRLPFPIVSLTTSLSRELWSVTYLSSSTTSTSTLSRLALSTPVAGIMCPRILMRDTGVLYISAHVLSAIHLRSSLNLVLRCTKPVLRSSNGQPVPTGLRQKERRHNDLPKRKTNELYSRSQIVILFTSYKGNGGPRISIALLCACHVVIWNTTADSHYLVLLLPKTGLYHNHPSVVDGSER